MTKGNKESKDTGGGGAFLTQKGEKFVEVKKEIAELQQLLAGATQTSQATQLLKKRKEMREVDDSLDLMKKDFKKRMDECEERRLQFELRQAKLREQVLKFEKFIQENDSKRQRAELKAKHERKIYEDKCKELALLQLKYQELLDSQKVFHNELNKKIRYREFLERLVEEGDEGYEEIGDILNRHTTLVDANKDLLTHSADREHAVDQLRHRYQQLVTESQNQLLVNNSNMNALQKEIENLRAFSKKEEEDKFKNEDKEKDLCRELTQISMATSNIFSRCFPDAPNKIIASVMQSKSKNTAANKTGKAVEQLPSDADVLKHQLEIGLELIHSRIVDLIEITSEYKEESKLGIPGGSNSSSYELNGENSTIGNYSVHSSHPPSVI
jgi:hypothetical protein